MSLAVSAEDAHGAPRTDPSASVIQLIAARCDLADRFSSGVPALGESGIKFGVAGGLERQVWFGVRNQVWGDNVGEIFRRGHLLNGF